VGVCNSSPPTNDVFTVGPGSPVFRAPLQRTKRVLYSDNIPATLRGGRKRTNLLGRVRQQARNFRRFALMNLTVGLWNFDAIVQSKSVMHITINIMTATFTARKIQQIRQVDLRKNTAIWQP